MKHHTLQSMVVSPRHSAYDPRIAQTTLTQRSVGSDGKLYRSINERDHEKFKVMTDEQLEMEMYRSQELQTKMMSSSGKIYGDKHLQRPFSASSPRLSFGAPMFKKASCSRASMDSNEGSQMLERNNTRNMRGTSPRINGTDTYMSASETHGDRSSRRGYSNGRISQEADEEFSRGRSHHAMSPHIRNDMRSREGQSESPAPASRTLEPTGSDASDGDNTPVTSVMNALKMKYEQNLDVIEKLFDEKKSMEKLVQSLDTQLSDARRELASPRYAGSSSGRKIGNYSPGGFSRSISKDKGSSVFFTGDNDVKNQSKPRHRESADYSNPFNSDTLSGRDAIKKDASKDFRERKIDTTSDDENYLRPKVAKKEKQTLRVNVDREGRSFSPSYSERRPASSYSSRASMSASISCSGQNLNQGHRRGRSGYDGADDSSVRSRVRSYSAGLENRNSRSGSRSRSFSTEPRISANLQADQDRYIQRRRAFENRENDRLEEQRRYEQSIQVKHNRASRSGGEFTEMIKRDALARKSSELKKELKKAQQLEEEKKSEEEKIRQKQLQLQRSRTKDDITWEEMKGMQEKLRMERATQRMVELSSYAGFEPSKGSEGVARQLAREKLAAKQDVPTPVGEPEEVLARLEQRRRDWDDKLERMKEVSRAARQQSAAEEREKSGITAAVGNKLFHGTASMVHRAVKAEEKRKIKSEEKVKKENEEKERTAAEEKRKRDIILSAKAPEDSRRLTKIAEVRAKMVRQTLQEIEAERLKEQARIERRQKAEKQHGEMLKTILSERDRDRKENYHGGFVELKKSQTEIDAVAAENRERFRTRLRENQSRINQAAEARPSLLIRHDQAVARSKAGSSALIKVAQAVVDGKLSVSTGGGKPSARVALNEDDIFDDTQKILLAYEDDFIND